MGGGGGGWELHHQERRRVIKQLQGFVRLLLGYDLVVIPFFIVGCVIMRITSK